MTSFLPFPCSCTPTPHTRTRVHTRKYATWRYGNLQRSGGVLSKDLRTCRHGPRLPRSHRLVAGDAGTAWVCSAVGTRGQKAELRWARRGPFRHFLLLMPLHGNELMSFMFSLVLAHKRMHIVWRKEMFCARAHTYAHTNHALTLTHTHTRLWWTVLHVQSAGEVNKEAS